ncbi:MAG: anti-sigma factor [Chloroflexota bacterium]|jgi:anti-sigma-K factor RskA|nr:anti-sigma factor [Chloroflexota bacterium]
MNTMDRRRFEELKDAYVLGAIAEEERRQFEEYVAVHPERQAEVEELGAVAGLLALSPQEQEPSPELRSRIMDAVGAEAVHPNPSHRSWLAWLRELLSVRSLAPGAAALLVIGLFSWSMLLRGEVQDLQGRVQTLQSQPQGPQMVTLGGAGTDQRARAELVTLEGDRAVLVVENMPPVPEGKTYQIWVIEDEVPKPSGLFKPRQDSVAAVVEHPLGGGDVIAVTVEPEGGSPKPTSEPMLAAEVRT